MNTLSRVVFEAANGVSRLIVLCGGCLHETRLKTDPANVRLRVRDYGSGSGVCEFCEHEILSEVGAL